MYRPPNSCYNRAHYAEANAERIDFLHRCPSVHSASEPSTISLHMPIDPIIAEHVDLPDLNSCPYGFLMHLGLQVDGDAWRDVVVRLCQRLLPLAAEAQAQGSEFRILSVKQKFDTLLVSYRGGTDEIKAEIGRTKDEALHLSARGRVDVATTALVTTIWKPLIIPRSTDGCRRNGEGGSRPTTRST